MTPTADEMQSLAMALGRVPSGLFILTARQGDRETGMLAFWVQQCSFEPPQMTVALRRAREVIARLDSGSRLSLNLLPEGQTNFISQLGRGFALDQPTFTGLNIDRMPGQPPTLCDAMGYLI